MKLQHSPRSVRALLLALATMVALPAAADATWSIVLVNQKTGEVAVGCATCLEGFNLEVFTPVILTGIGAANAQSAIDSTGANRRYIWDKMQEGIAPIGILAVLAAIDPGHQNRQYGIVDLRGRKQSFTGTNCGAWAGGVAGRDGPIYYAIQGNVLVGQLVVDECEKAITDTDGDLADKLMAAMEAAQVVGGDGRCSCSPSAPTACGAPPPAYDPTTDKSAHVGFMIIARIGDIDGECDVFDGCATGSYYLNLNVTKGTKADPDPVIQLRGLFDTWRDSWRDRPDHIRSTAKLDDKTLPGNGTATTTLTLVLNDWEDTAIGHGGAAVTVRHSKDSAGLSTIGTPVDLGDGSYTVEITAGAGQGDDEFEIVVDDGEGPVTLYPFPELPHTATLKADVASISATAGGTVNFELIGPETTPAPPYLLLATASGTTPGMLFSDLIVPLNLDAMVFISYLLRNTPNFVNTDSTLLPDGTSTAQFVVLPGDLLPLVGYELDFAFFKHTPVSFASNFVPLVVDP